MIAVTRTNKPDVLVQNSETWTKDYLEAIEKYKKNQNSTNKKKLDAAEKKYNQASVKTALKKMFYHKCAFCESKITSVDYGQIEHFKPKSKYPKLCFEWNNFLLSCAICNGISNKGDKFPLENEGGPLVNPVDENPLSFFKFEYDKKLKTFLVFPKNQRAITTINILGLNREDLVENRKDELIKIINILEQVLDLNDKKTITKFTKLFSEKDQYFAFIKNIFDNIKK